MGLSLGFIPWVYPLGLSLGFIPWVYPLGLSLGFIPWVIGGLTSGHRARIAPLFYLTAPLNSLT
ncbi:hypothetical protein HHE06_14060 [Helicobacter heilmannii]|nr:hypothetical protein HHE06_14060 [Helicobacter heilmannii]